jgi:RNA polymerase sigma factor (sigma-70 family)
MTNTLLQAVARKAEGLTADAELLARFVETRDPRAFEEVVRRHGPLVWSVCHRALPNRADAEDAFQAVFLALVRSAPTIRDGRALPSWLHGAAVRACLKAKRSFARRAARERAAAQPEASQPVGDAAWEALVLAVHEEVQRLPGAERAAFVLCELEGVSQPDAAARLGWPLGSLSGRLCKARQKLLELLAARGIAPAVGIGLTAGAAHAVPEHLVGVATSLPAGAGAASSAALALARGLTEGVTMRVKLAVAAGVLAAALGATGGAALLSKADAQPPVPAKTAPGAPPGMGAGVGGPGGIPGGGAPAGFGGQPPAKTPGAPPGMGGGAGGPGGFPGGGLGGGPGVGGMGDGFSGIAQPMWEYKFVEFKGDRKAFEQALTANGRDGWEFCTSERFGEGNRSETVLVFKKPKGGPVFSGGGMFGGGGGAPGGGGGRGSGGAGGGDAGGGRVPGGPGGNTGGGPRPAPGGMGPGVGGTGPGGFGPPMGPGDAADNQFHVLILKNAAAADLATVLGSVFPNSRFVAETRANALIVIRCDAPTLKKVTELVEKLDVVVAKPK